MCPGTKKKWDGVIAQNELPALPFPGAWEGQGGCQSRQGRAQELREPEGKGTFPPLPRRLTALVILQSHLGLQPLILPKWDCPIPTSGCKGMNRELRKTPLIMSPSTGCSAGTPRATPQDVIHILPKASSGDLEGRGNKTIPTFTNKPPSLKNVWWQERKTAQLSI